MPNSIALTRIHTPEDYWLRMALAEDQLVTYAKNRSLQQAPAQGMKHAGACLTKAQQLSDRYHERWTSSRKDYFG